MGMAYWLVGPCEPGYVWYEFVWGAGGGGRVLDFFYFLFAVWYRFVVLNAA